MRIKKRAKPKGGAEDVLRAYASSLPGAKEDWPWEEWVCKVNGKIFAWIGGYREDDDPRFGVGVKLPKSGKAVLKLPIAEPMAYGMGKHGWVSITWPTVGDADVEQAKKWIEESFCAVAPAKLAAQIDPTSVPPEKRKPAKAAAKRATSKAKPTKAAKAKAKKK